MTWTTAKENAMGCNSQTTRDVAAVAVESLASPLNITKRPTIPAKSTHHKEKRDSRGLQGQESCWGHLKVFHGQGSKGLGRGRGGTFGEPSDCLNRLHSDQLFGWDSVFRDTNAGSSLWCYG